MNLEQSVTVVLLVIVIAVFAIPHIWKSDRKVKDDNENDDDIPLGV